MRRGRPSREGYILYKVKKIAEENYIKVNEINYGEEKDIILDCTVKSLDIYSSIAPQLNEFFNVDVKKDNGMYKSASDFTKEFEQKRPFCHLK